MLICCERKTLSLKSTVEAALKNRLKLKGRIHATLYPGHFCNARTFPWKWKMYEKLYVCVTRRGGSRQK
jgi:hypothetical protein